MKYAYPAVFEPGDKKDCIVIFFPDLPGCYSQGFSLAEALEMAQDALAQWIGYLIDKDAVIPAASAINEVTTDVEGAFVILVYAEVRDNRAVRRTVSLPRWMDEKASAAGLSLSRVLQDALNAKLS